jgi:hypothetical protein
MKTNSKNPVADWSEDERRAFDTLMRDARYLLSAHPGIDTSSQARATVALIDRAQVLFTQARRLAVLRT